MYVVTVPKYRAFLYHNVHWHKQQCGADCCKRLRYSVQDHRFFSLRAVLKDPREKRESKVSAVWTFEVKRKLFVGVTGVGAEGRTAIEMEGVQANSPRICGCRRHWQL